MLFKITFNPLVYENVSMITSSPTKHTSAISQRFTHKMAAKASWHRNYVTVILCMNSRGFAPRIGHKILWCAHPLLPPSFFPCSSLHKRVSFRPPTTQFNCRHPGVLWHQLTPFERAVAVRPSCGPAAADGSLLRFQSTYSTNVCEQKFSLSAQTAGLI